MADVSIIDGFQKNYMAIEFANELDTAARSAKRQQEQEQEQEQQQEQQKEDECNARDCTT